MAQEMICKAIAVIVAGKSTDLSGVLHDSSVVVYSTEDGRPDPRPRIIAPDSDGVLWYWTEDPNPPAEAPHA